MAPAMYTDLWMRCDPNGTKLWLHLQMCLATVCKVASHGVPAFRQPSMGLPSLPNPQPVVPQQFRPPDFHMHAGLPAVPPKLGKRSLLTLSDACTEDDLVRASLGFHVECMQDMSEQDTGADNRHHNRFGPNVHGDNHNNRRLKTLSDACTEADYLRAEMGMPVSCLGGYGNPRAGAINPHNGRGQAHHVGPEPNSLNSGFNTESGRKLRSDGKRLTR